MKSPCLSRAEQSSADSRAATPRDNGLGREAEGDLDDETESE